MEASEAFELSEESVTANIPRLYSIISSAAKQGKKLVHIYEPLTGLEDKQLRADGYAVSEIRDRDGVLVTIDWSMPTI